MSSSSRFYDIPRYQVQITSLAPGVKIPLSVSVPAGLRVRGQDYGINANRANAVVKGTIAFNRANELPFAKIVGESPQDSRIGIPGEYWLEGQGEGNSKFACILVKQPATNHIDYKVVVMNRGDRYLVDNTSESPKDIFLCEGLVSVNGTSYSALGDHEFRHFEIRSGSQAEFFCDNDQTVCLIEIIRLSKEDLLEAAKGLYPDQYQDIGWASA